MRCVLALTAFLALGCAGLAPKNHAIDADDRAAFVEADEAYRVLGIEGVPQRVDETWTKTRDFDGTWEIEYAYEGGDAMVSQVVFYDPSSEDDGATWIGLTMGMAIGAGGEEGIELVEAPHLLTWGNRQECSILRAEGFDAGWVCVAQKGPTSVLISVVGLGAAVDGDGALDRLLAEQLAALDTYVPAEAPLEE